MNTEQQTSIDKNPFAILGLSTRDNRHRIIEVSEEKSLSINPDVCAKARADLTNPRNRLTIEIAWLPGVSPKKTRELLSVVRNDPNVLLNQLDTEPLALANLIASAIEIADEQLSVDEWSAWILKLAKTFEAINPEKVLRDINEDRSVSGFQEIKSIDLIEKEILQRRRLYKGVVRGALDRMGAIKLVDVVTSVVGISTETGTKHALTLVDDIVDSYQLETQTPLQKGMENIFLLVEKIKQSAPMGEASLGPAIDALRKSTLEWDKIAQPIQLSLKSRGLDHDLSFGLAGRIRSLVIDLTNEHGFLDASRKLTDLLKEAFAELPELVERVEKDAHTLDGMIEKQRLLELIRPITSLCETAIRVIENDPKAADALGLKLFGECAPMLTKMQSDGMPKEQILAAKNHLAGVLAQCSIAYGNATDKWLPCIRLLEMASDLATDEPLVNHINKNLDVVRKNERLGGIGAVTNAPSLHTINGVGVTLYGATDYDAETCSHIATYYFVVFFLPVFPLARYRVIKNGNSYRFLAKFPLRNFDKWHIAFSLTAIAILFFAL